MDKKKIEGLRCGTEVISAYLMTVPKNEAIRLLTGYAVKELDILKDVAIQQEDYEVCTIINEIKTGAKWQSAYNYATNTHF